MGKLSNISGAMEKLKAILEAMGKHSGISGAMKKLGEIFGNGKALCYLRGSGKVGGILGAMGKLWNFLRTMGLFHLGDHWLAQCLLGALGTMPWWRLLCRLGSRTMSSRLGQNSHVKRTTYYAAVTTA